MSEARPGLFAGFKVDWYLVLIILMAVAASVIPARDEAAVWLGWASKILIAVVFFLCLFPLVQATYALERRLGRSDT